MIVEHRAAVDLVAGLAAQRQMRADLAGGLALWSAIGIAAIAGLMNRGAMPTADVCASAQFAEPAMNFRPDTAGVMNVDCLVDRIFFPILGLLL